MSIAICIPRIIGSGTAQKLCIVSVTGTRNSTNSHSVTHKPPSVAITPDSGTRNAAAGTPCCAAYPMKAGEKCPNTVIKKIAEKRNRPTGTS